MHHDETKINQFLDATAYDRDGEKIGGVSGVYLDDQTSEPMWVTVNTGLFGLSSSFAPLAGSSLSGDRLTLDVHKDQVKDAPNIDEDGHITREQEDELYRYYQVDSADVGTDRMRTRRYGDDAVADGEHRPGGPLFTNDRDRDVRGPVGDRDRHDNDAVHTAERREGRDAILDDGRRVDDGLVDDRREYDQGAVHTNARPDSGLRDEGRRDDDLRDDGLRHDDRKVGGASAREDNAPADIEGDPVYRNDPSFVEDQARQGDERYVENDRLMDERHDEPGTGREFAGDDPAGRPDAADGPVADRRRGADPIDNLFDNPDERPTHNA